MNTLTKEQTKKRDIAIATANPKVKEALKDQELLSFINALFALDETKFFFKEGQIIKFYNHIGKIKLGEYVMDSKEEGYIMLKDCDSFGGALREIPLSALVK
jgi:hypothetical protein